MEPCIIKSFGGCACRDGECAEKPVTPAPLIFISWRTQAATCLFIGALAGIIAFAAAGRAEPYLKRQALEQQEQIRQG